MRRATISGYDDLHRFLRSRVEELNTPRSELDRLANFPSGWSGKVLQPVPDKRLSVDSVLDLLATLGCVVEIHADPDALQRHTARMRKRKNSLHGSAEHEVVVMRKSRATLRRMGRKGAKIWAQKISPKKRQKIARNAARSRWRRVRQQQLTAGRAARQRALLKAETLAATLLQGASAVPCASLSPLPNGS